MNVSTFERVDPENPEMGGRRKLKESASHHVQEICFADSIFLNFGLIFPFASGIRAIFETRDVFEFLMIFFRLRRELCK